MSAIILLDEDFYNYGDTKEYIDELTLFLEQFWDLDLSAFHPFCNIGNNWAQKNMLASIQLKFQKLNRLEIFDKEIVVPSSNLIYNCLEFSSDFIGEINFLLSKYDDIIIPVVQGKHKFNIKKPQDHVYIINHIYEEVNSNFSHFILNNIYIKNIIHPNIASPLPNKKLCKNYYIVQKRLIENGSDKFQTYSSIAREVANRNTYSFNKIVSQKNTNKNKNHKKNKREIYDNDGKIYISTDFESGCFEFYNSRGKHQGERSYTNDIISNRDETGWHDIQL